MLCLGRAERRHHPRDHLTRMSKHSNGNTDPSAHRAVRWALAPREALEQVVSRNGANTQKVAVVQKTSQAQTGRPTKQATLSSCESDLPKALEFPA